MSSKILYHGSINKIEHPIFGAGYLRNDYGRGFYCTENPELAKEWACTFNASGLPCDGYANKYELKDMEDLTILYLSDGNHNMLDWLTVLLQNRTFNMSSDIARAGADYLTEHFLIDISGYDVIEGYRADDSYFSFADNFLNNTISLQKLSAAMRLGALGKQLVLMSEKAFANIEFLEAIEVDGKIYGPKRALRDKRARDTYFNGVKAQKALRTDIYMLDILRGEMKRDDPRLQ